MTPLTDEQLAAIEAREKAAHDGPWAQSDVVFTISQQNGRVIAFECGDPDDREFIAHAREDVLLLLAEVRRLRAELAAAVAMLTKLRRTE